MPTFNLTPILYPKPKTDSVYDMLKDLLEIREKDYALLEGGEINNPATYDPLIAEWENIVNNPSLSDAQRREAEKKLRDYQIKQAKAALDKKKSLSAKDIQADIEKDLRELEFEFPGNPIAFSAGAIRKYQDILYGTSEREGLNQLIPIMKGNDIDTFSLEQYRDEAQEELVKYSDIVDAFEGGDFSRLNEYAVVYTPHSGKVMAMKIINKGTTDPSYSQKTDMKFSRDEAGNINTVSDSNNTIGLSIFLTRANVSAGDKYSFGNSQLTYQGERGWTSDGAFDLMTLKHAPVHSVPSGGFVRDSNNKLFFVNRDKSFFPVREGNKAELGFSEDKVYNLSPSEEMNFLPGAIDHTTFPVMERYQQEAADATGGFSQWKAFKESIGEELKKPTQIPKMWGGIGQAIGKGLKGFIDTTKESWVKGVSQVGQQKKVTPVAPDYSLKETKPTTIIKESQKIWEKIKPPKS